jgi:hypothetical protein
MMTLMLLMVVEIGGAGINHKLTIFILPPKLRI